MRALDLQPDAEAHFLQPALAVGRLSRVEEGDEVQVEALVEDRLVVAADAVLLDLVEISVEQVNERVGRTTCASGTEYGDALAHGEQYFLGCDTATAEDQQPRQPFTRGGEQTEQLDVLRQVTVPARRCAGTLLENPEQVQQRVRDGVLIDPLGELEAGVLPAVAEGLVRARSVTPGAGPVLRIVRVVRPCNGIHEAGCFHCGHRARQGLTLIEHSRAAAAESDPVEPEGLRRIAAKQADDQVEHGAAVSLAAEACSARDVEVADDALHGADEDRRGNRFIHIADHQGHVAAGVAGDELRVPGFTRGEELIVTNSHWPLPTSLRVRNPFRG